MAKRPPLDVRGSTTVITGAAAGMGADVARQLAARGARIALPSTATPTGSPRWPRPSTAPGTPLT